MSKKKIIIAVLVAIVAIALGWYFLYFTKTPVYSLNLAREAVEKHDLNAFKKHVDVDSIIGSGYDDVVAMQLEDPEIKNNPLKGLAAVSYTHLFTVPSDSYLATSISDIYKPELLSLA